VTRFEQLCARKRAQFGDKFVAPTDPVLIDAYNKGDRFRIKVDSYYGAHRPYVWDYVGVTTGWAPSFLLLLTRRQTGSFHTLPTGTKVHETRWIR